MKIRIFTYDTGKEWYSSMVGQELDMDSMEGEWYMKKMLDSSGKALTGMVPKKHATRLDE